MKLPGSVRRNGLLYRTPYGWRWRLSDPFNGLTTSAGTQAYVRRDQALYNLLSETGILLPEDKLGRRGSIPFRVVLAARAVELKL